MKTKVNANILVIGSTVCDVMIYLDRLPSREGDAHIQSQHWQVGGCAYNVARFLKQVGAEIDFLSPVGSGVYGDFVASELGKQGFDLPIRLAGANGCCYCFVESDGERTFLSDHGVEYRFDKAWLATLPKLAYDYIYVCGLEVEEETGQALIEALKQLTGQIIFAPGPRLSLIAPKKMAMLLAMSPILHLNEAEAMDLGQSAELNTAIKAIYAKTQALVIVTKGADGAVAYDGTWYEAAAYPSQVVDTIGAGDSHVAAVLAALDKEQSVASALDFANKAASLVVASQGTYLTANDYELLQADLDRYTEK